VYTPALEQVSHDLAVTRPSLLHLSVSAYIFGFAAGPVLVWPLSGRIGRLPIFRTGSACLALLNLLCAFAGSIYVLIILRFLAGIAGSTPMALGPATIVDLFRKEERSKALALMAIGGVGGPILGPSLGGLIAQSVGWRSCFVMLACVVSKTPFWFCVQLVS
jgi:multidrug resistance protein